MHSLGREAIFDDKPLWNHVTVVSTPKARGGNRVWSCNYFSKKVTGLYSKVKTQLLKIPNQGVEGCKAFFDDALMEVKREYHEVEKRKSNEMLKARTRAEYVTLSSRIRFVAT